MLKSLVKWFTLFIEERQDIRVRNRKLRELKQYCLESGFGFYPELAKEFPVFAEEVNRYIEEKAKRDLPAIQFNNEQPIQHSTITDTLIPSFNMNITDISKLKLDEVVEIGGILGYDGDKLFEMNYCPPNQSYIHLMAVTRLDYVLISSTSQKFFYSRDLERAEVVVNWHSHPFAFCDLTKGDINYIKEKLEFFGSKLIYSVIFVPARNRSYWYQIKSTS